jgi:hypothetical protein
VAEISYIGFHKNYRFLGYDAVKFGIYVLESCCLHFQDQHKDRGINLLLQVDKYTPIYRHSYPKVQDLHFTAVRIKNKEQFKNIYIASSY